jgi:murein DD-endopeptidase MepM/ murein hydrolase activator NlpD
MMFCRFILTFLLSLVLAQAPVWAKEPVHKKSGEPKNMVLVRKGENLLAVAKRAGTTPDDLIKSNGLLKPYQIYIGQPLIYHKIQKAESKSEAVKAPAVKDQPSLKQQEAVRKSAVPSKPAVDPEPKKQSTTQEVSNQSDDKDVTETKPEAEVKRTGKHFSWPLKGKILSAYGKKQMGLTNDGINIEAKFQTPVKAAEDGVVAYAGNEIRGFGNVILIKHGDGWSSVYAHNDILLVSKGVSVKRGQDIAKSGNTGHVDAPQLHFELRHKAKSVDPLIHLK